MRLRVAVVGGGLGGCAAAIALRGVGAEVTVFEAAPAPRREGQSVSLLMNGTAAFAALRVGGQPGQRITRVSLLHSRTGRHLVTVDAAELERLQGHPYVVVPRNELLDPLLGALDGHVAYSKRAVGVANTGSGAEVHFADGSSEFADLVVAADGAHSCLRLSLWPQDGGRLLSFAFQGTVDLPPDYPSDEEVFLSMAPGAFLGTFPTTRGRIGWFIEERAGSTDRPPAPVRDYLLRRVAEGWAGPIGALIEATPEEEVAKEVYPIRVRRPPRTWGDRRIVLLGDAAHALNPALGQGTNQAFTDAVALARAVSRSGSADDVLPTYSRSRARRTTLYWRMAKTMLNPWYSTMTNSLGWTTNRMATRSWTLLTRPDPVVRETLS